ncbi:hypothetical protein [Hydrogenophaga sp.]|uniref:hypothetical protein n=1 Tax=Hydrogenophaga sp. TaxID=1904254 RepID=UPI003F6D6857
MRLSLKLNRRKMRAAGLVQHLGHRPGGRGQQSPGERVQPPRAASRGSSHNDRHDNRHNNIHDAPSTDTGFDGITWALVLSILGVLYAFIL